MPVNPSTVYPFFVSCFSTYWDAGSKRGPAGWRRYSVRTRRWLSQGRACSPRVRTCIQISGTHVNRQLWRYIPVSSVLRGSRETGGPLVLAGLSICLNRWGLSLLREFSLGGGRGKYLPCHTRVKIGVHIPSAYVNVRWVWQLSCNCSALEVSQTPAANWWARLAILMSLSSIEKAYLSE